MKEILLVIMVAALAIIGSRLFSFGPRLEMVRTENNELVWE